MLLRSCATTLASAALFAGFVAAQTSTGLNIFATGSPLNVRAGTPVTVRWSAPSTDYNPVTVYLVASPSLDVITFSTLTQANSNPGSLTWTPSTHLPNGGNYMYQIYEQERINYSPHFTLAGGSEPTCSWAGHCAGTACKTDDDCSDDLSCQFGVCAIVNVPTVSGVTCSWPGHCVDATCKADGDCSDELVCRNAKCTNLSTGAATPGPTSPGPTSPNSSSPTGMSTTNDASTSSKAHKAPIAAIIGGAVGGVAVLLAAGFIAICLCRRRSGNTEAEVPRPPPPEPENPYFGGMVASPHVKAELDATQTPTRPPGTPKSPGPKPAWLPDTGTPGTPPGGYYGDVGRVHELA